MATFSRAVSLQDASRSSGEPCQSAFFLSALSHYIRSFHEVAHSGSLEGVCVVIIGTKANKNASIRLSVFLLPHIPTYLMHTRTTFSFYSSTSCLPVTMGIDKR